MHSGLGFKLKKEKRRKKKKSQAKHAWLLMPLKVFAKKGLVFHFISEGGGGIGRGEENLY